MLTILQIERSGERDQLLGKRLIVSKRMRAKRHTRRAIQKNSEHIPLRRALFAQKRLRRGIPSTTQSMLVILQGQRFAKNVELKVE